MGTSYQILSKLIMSFALVFVVVGSLEAQRTIRGKVIDPETSEGLIGLLLMVSLKLYRNER